MAHTSSECPYGGGRAVAALPLSGNARTLAGVREERVEKRMPAEKTPPRKGDTTIVLR